MPGITKDIISPVNVSSRGGLTHEFVTAMALVAGIRILVFCIGLLSIYSAPPNAEPRFDYEHPWVAWDARHYYEIALHGYSPDRQGRPYREQGTFSLAAYFPLVPLTNRALATLMPLGAASVLLSNTCSIIGFGFLYDWARRVAGARAALICVLLTATFPGAVSFAAGMSEGPFFMLVALVLWLLELEHFCWAALFAGITTACRPTGIALAMIVPFYAWIRQPGQTLNARLLRVVVLGIISCSGIICYELFVWHRYQSPTAYFDAQIIWNQLDQNRLHKQAEHGAVRYSWEFFKEHLTSPQAWNRGISLIILAVTLVGLIRPGGIPRILFLLPLVIFLMTCLPNRGMRISSLPRYESGVAPLFLLPAIWLCAPRRAPALTILLLLQFAVQLYYAFLFPREIWVG